MPQPGCWDSESDYGLIMELYVELRKLMDESSLWSCKILLYRRKTEKMKIQR